MSGATAIAAARIAQGMRLRPAATLGVLLAVLAAASLLVGPAGLGIPGEGAAARLILLEIRLPRVLLGMLVGAALGASGAALQGYLRNPLAEPGVLGVSSGAALGAVVAIHSGLAAALPLALPALGLAGAALATLTVVMLAGTRAGPLTLILAGLAVSTLAGALTTLALNLAPNPFAASEMVFWMLGSLNDRSLVHVGVAAPLIAAGVGVLMTLARPLDALTLGEDAAANLGIDLGGLRWRIVAGTALAVGAATAVTGAIGFVGLVVPHLLRRWCGHRPGALLAASALGGGVLVLLADLMLRLAAPLADIRLGVVTALVGAPFFLALVLRTRRELAP